MSEFLFITLKNVPTLLTYMYKAARSMTPLGRPHSNLSHISIFVTVSSVMCTHDLL